MSIDRAKAMQSAQKYLAKGQLDKAITEYEKLVKDDPKDGRLLLKLGDLYTRQGDNKEACIAYRKVAEQYAEQGFFLKAVAVCKQILKLDPGQLDTWERLGEMYEMLSLGNDAVATYEQVAEAHTRAGNHRKALRAFEKVAELDAENVAARIRYAEALSKLNKPDEAALAFAQGAEVLKRQGRIDDYLKVGERLLYHQPDNYDFAREIAAAYLDRGEAKNSLAKLQACFNADPKNIETLQLLARAFEQLGQTQKTVSVLKELARLHGSERRAADQATVLRRILALDPQDADTRRELSQMGSLPRQEESSAAIMIDEDDADYDELVVEEDEEPPSKTGSGLRDLALVAEEQKQERITRLLNECGVFLRYGLNDKMIKQLHEVLTLDPKHVEARLKLKDAYLRVKQPAEAAKQLTTLSEIVERSDRTLAIACAREVVKLEPRNMRALERVRILESAAAPADDDEVIFVDDEEPSASRNEAETGRVSEVSAYERPEESFASVIPDAYTEELAAPPPLATADDDDDVIVLDDDDEDAMTAEAARLGAGTAASGRPQAYNASIMPPPASAPAFAPPVAAAPLPSAAGMAPPAAVIARPPTPVAASIAPRRPAVSHPPAPGEQPEGELDDALEEIDFYLKQGLEEEARDTLTDALENFPDHPALLAKLRQLDGEPEATAPLSDASDHSFELAQKLAEEVAPPAASGTGPIEVADVLAAFKRGVAKQIDKGDTATHYDLGIAYMEMGLHAEAIDEFKICLADPTRRCAAHTMIGLSYVAKGDMEPGLDHFKLALESDPTAEVECGLWFEMGNAHELLGKNMEALVWYEKVEERNPTFRDVALRIERLGTARTPQQEADEFDEMFDNMILKE